MVLSAEELVSLDELLNQKCIKEKIPGMALVVCKSGIPIFEKYYGFRDLERSLPVTADTVFGVASITKSMAALAIMQLEDKGKLHVEDLVVQWLPEFKLPNAKYEKELTIHHLMTHTSGLPGMAAINRARANSIRNDPDGAYLFGEIEKNSQPITNVTDLLKAMNAENYTLLGSPGEFFNYSNESYGMLQAIIEKASGEQFIPYMKKHILAPLGMNRSTFLTADFKQLDNITELYAYTKEKRAVFHSPTWWDVGDIYSNGSLKASVSDIMKYLQVYLHDGVVNGKRIVSAKSIDKMTTPLVTTPNENQYGYGLQINNEFASQLIGHGGSIKGVSANVQIAKEYDLSVAVLINIADVDAEEIAMMTISHFIGKKVEKAPKTFGITKEKIEDYVGNYQSNEGHRVKVLFSNGNLYLNVKGNQIVVKNYARDKFITSEYKKLAFIRNKQGLVVGIFIGMRYISKE